VISLRWPLSVACFLLASVRALPGEEQCCLSLRAEGLRYREIAEVPGISPGSVAASLEKSPSRLIRAEQTWGRRRCVA
jgi:RNA polymerase sigma-70 factor (ECF subfamily)